MDFIVELIFDLIFEGSIEISSNRKISKWIRYPLIFMISVIYLGITALLFAVGVSMFGESMLSAMLLIGIGLLLLVCVVAVFIKVYLKKR